MVVEHFVFTAEASYIQLVIVVKLCKAVQTVFEIHL